MIQKLQNLEVKQYSDTQNENSNQKQSISAYKCRIQNLESEIAKIREHIKLLIEKSKVDSELINELKNRTKAEGILY